MRSRQSDPAPALLVVDDDPAFRGAVVRLLRDEAIEVVSVHSGAAALTTLDGQSFALAVVDAQMHPMDGFELAAALLSRAPDLPVLMVSGLETTEVLERARAAGCTNVIDALPKPIYRGDLLKAIRAGWGGARPAA